jgi:two-component system, NarL family, nitrate/nitrite response regulator NarL
MLNTSEISKPVKKTLAVNRSNHFSKPIEQSQPIKILLVDDHKSMLWGLERLIESEHPHMQVVGKASNRAEVFAVLQSTQADIILLDLDLNGESSLDFLEEMLQQSQAQILVLTATQDPAVHQRAILAGASGVVLKSENAEIILRAIKTVHAGEVWFDRAATSRLLRRLNHSANQNDGGHSKKIATLTPKERQIVVAMAALPGARNKMIADQLCMSEHTLRNHLTCIYAKLELANRLELVMYVIEHKLANHSADV